MVSVIILSYDTQELLKNCLTSVKKHLQGVDHEVIVVDNASSDQSAHMVKKEFPTVRLIENSENVGFAKGVNIGAKKAKGAYLLLLNSDITMDDDNTEKMIQFMDTHPRVAVVGGDLMNSDGSTSKSHGAFYSLGSVFAMLFHEGRRAQERKKIAESEVDWVSGGYMLIRKSVFDTIGGFDEHFFMYMEDMEFCYRIKKSGYTVIYFPSSRVAHKGQGSSNRGFAVIQIYKGLKYFYKKHKSLPENIALSFLLFIKGISAYSIGVLTNNMYLKDTYGKALQIAL